jgi:GR25 family glycosyltransferase involved in LPS biosynthesis
MKSFAIVIKDNIVSENGFKSLLKSANDTFVINRFDAIVPETAYETLNSFGLKWNYPWEGYVYDSDILLKKSAYSTRVKEKRIACSLSHYALWLECISLNEPILIFEHDAIIIKSIHEDLFNTSYDILGINDPRGATRRSNIFHDTIQKSKHEYLNVPIVDDMLIPQGLAGNSAYIIKPAGAKKLIELCKEHGLWPNDAIMCQQLVPNLGVTKTYYTNLQRLESTTTL